MGLMVKLFGGKTDESEKNEAQGSADERVHAGEAPVELEAMPELTAMVEAEQSPEMARLGVGSEAAEAIPEGIRAFDQDGREVMVPREEWRTNVLPGMVKEAWDNPDHLYAVILNSISDGFVNDITEAAQHLYETDILPARGACMWGVALIQTGRLDEAERVLAGFGETGGEDGSVLVNLAKVYAARGEGERAETTLWRALEVEPNLDNGLGWYAGLAQERGGEQGARTALERVAAMPASWRAQLWLARAELAGGELGRARALYTEALERAPRPVPPDLLMQMSGDLGGRGHLAELVSFTRPHFVPEVHGLPVGNNLLKALMDTGDLDAAMQVREGLRGLARPDWKGALDFWDAEIARRQAANVSGAPGTEIQIGMLRVDGPVWLPPGSPARRIFGAKATGVPSVTFLGGTAETPSAEGEAHLQLADMLGRMTRSLPLYLAEQTEMRTAAAGRAMVPWAVGRSDTGEQPSGFVVSGTPWPDETAVQAAGSDPASGSDYVVTVHLDAEVEPWTAELAFVRTSDGVRIGELQAEFAPESPDTGLPRLADEVVELLSALGPASAAAAYVVPEGAAFGAYLLRLEQLLAVRCASMDGVSTKFLNGEREILSGEAELCMAEPENVAVRLLLVETFGAMERARPEIAAEFRGTFERLIAERPLPLVDAVFARTV